MTARDLITSSLRLLGVAASGEAISASEANDGLLALNNLIDSWSTQSLLIPTKIREVFPLVSGQQTYTMGTGGNFNTARPIRIEQALLQQGSGVSTLELPVKIITKDEYAGIILKQTQSTFPTYLYPDHANPLASLNFWPVPTVANNIVLYSWKPLSQLANLSTTLSLPPGYERALRFSLAIDLSAEYGKALPEQVIMIAAEAKAELKRMNFRPQYLQVDDALRARPAAFNWMTGEPT